MKLLWLTQDLDPAVRQEAARVHAALNYRRQVQKKKETIATAKHVSRSRSTPKSHSRSETCRHGMNTAIQSSPDLESVDNAHCSEISYHLPTMLPMPWTSLTDNSLSCFLNSYVPSVWKRPNFQGRGKDTTILPTVYQTILADRTVTNAFVAVSAFMSAKRKSRLADISTDGYSHWQQAVVDIRDRLSDERCWRTDEMLLAVGALFFISTMSGDFTSATIHSNAMKQLYRHRHGRPMPGLLDRSPEETHKFLDIARRNHINACSTESSLHTSRRLPTGLDKGPILDTISSDVLSLLNHVDSDLSTGTLASSCGLHGTYCMRLLQTISTKASNEELLCLAMLALCIFADTERRYSSMLNPYLQMHSSWLLDTLMTGDTDFLLWIGIVLAIALGPDTITARLALHILRSSKHGGTTVSAAIVACEQYLWNEELSQSLLESTLVLRTPDLKLKQTWIMSPAT